jgi:hypothetical protein
VGGFIAFLYSNILWSEEGVKPPLHKIGWAGGELLKLISYEKKIKTGIT